MKSAFDLWALKTKRSPLIKRLRNAKIERMKSYEELRVKRKELVINKKSKPPVIYYGVLFRNKLTPSI